MEKIFVLFAILLSFSSCISPSYLSEDFKLEGVFVNKEKKWIELKFQDNNFVYYDSYKQVHMNPIICCDTISYGIWRMDSRGFAALESPSNFDFYIMKPIEVTERKDFSSDSLYFIINNPIEDFFVKNKWKSSSLAYNILLFTKDFPYNTQKKDQIIFANKIVVPKEKEIKGFEITALVNPEFQFRLSNTETLLVETQPHEIKDPKANVFEIYIPDVNFKFLSLKRLKNDYVKIINKNKLLWDGKEYIHKR